MKSWMSENSSGKQRWHSAVGPQHLAVPSGQQVTPSQQNAQATHVPIAGSHCWQGGQTTPSQEGGGEGRQRPAWQT